METIEEEEDGVFEPETGVHTMLDTTEVCGECPGAEVEAEAAEVE